MTRILTKEYPNNDFGIFRCIAHKEKVIDELFNPWIKVHPEFAIADFILVGPTESILKVIITDNLQEIQEFNDTTGSSGNNK